MTISEKIQALISLCHQSAKSSRIIEQTSGNSQPTEADGSTTAKATSRQGQSFDLALTDRQALQAIRDLLTTWKPLLLLPNQGQLSQLEIDGQGLSAKQLLELLDRAGLAIEKQLAAPELLIQKLMDFPATCTKHQMLQAILQEEICFKGDQELLKILLQISNQLETTISSASGYQVSSLQEHNDQASSTGSLQPVERLLTLIQTISGKIVRDLQSFEEHLLKVIKQQLVTLPQIEDRVISLLNAKSHTESFSALQENLTQAQNIIKQQHPYHSRIFSFLEGLQESLNLGHNISLSQPDQTALDPIAINRNLPANKEIKAILAPLFTLMGELENYLYFQTGNTGSTIVELLSLLHTLRDALHGQNDKPITRLLNKISDTVKQAIKDEQNQTTEQITKQKEQVFTKVIEQVWRTHESLNQLNTLSQIAGDPVFIFFPTVIAGLLTRFEITYYHFSKEQATQEKGKKRNKTFDQMQIKTVLPAIGAININISFYQPELYLTINCQDQLMTEEISLRLPQLEKRLLALGYTKQNLSCKCAEIKEIKPAWLNSYIRPPEIIA